MKPQFNIRLLFVAVAVAGSTSLFLAWAFTSAPVVTSIDGVDGGKLFRIRGPIVIQQPAQPTIAFSSLDHSKFGMASKIPFFVVFNNEPGQNLEIEPESFLYQGAAIISKVSLGLKNGKLDVVHDISAYPFDGSPSWYSDGTPAPPFEENIDFYLPELPGDEPATFNLEKGRVFVVNVDLTANTITQHDLQLFTPAQIQKLDSIDLGKYVYRWWHKNAPQKGE